MKTNEEKIEMEATEVEATEQVEESKKKGFPDWAKFVLTFLGGTIVGAALTALLGGEAEDEDNDEVVHLSDDDYRSCDSDEDSE